MAAKYIQTPEQVREGFMMRMVRRFQRERELKERVAHLERMNKILAQRLEREKQIKRIFNGG